MMLASLMLAAGIDHRDIFNNTTLIVVALLSIAGSFALSVYDRRSRRREVGSQWEDRADELAKQLHASYADRFREKDRQLEAVTQDRDYWRDRWMGRRNDR